MFMESALQAVLPIPIITLIVELLKEFGLPNKWAKLVVFLLACFACVFQYYNQPAWAIVLNTLTMATAAVGAYEMGVKPVKTMVEKGSEAASPDKTV